MHVRGPHAMYNTSKCAITILQHLVKRENYGLEVLENHLGGATAAAIIVNAQ